MFYNVVVNDWGETTYVPTALGNVLLLVVIAALLSGAILFARRYAAKQQAEAEDPVPQQKGKLTVKQLAFCAMSIALGTVLSEIKIIDFPWGGSATLLSMFVICLPGYFFGLGAGLMTSIAYGVLQLLIDPYVLYPMQLVLDYLLAFGALGLSGLFANAKKGLLKGYLAGILGRYVFVSLSGWIFFAEYAWEGWLPLPYSLVYNGIYIFAEGAITLIILALPPVQKAVGAVKKMALS
ncbi:MAG: energy-coupled thiamine transporter ThiT [Bacteroidales bacterium]|nr:energy-coupled thiamine transporter ThiT [Bacteroidales bacterium]MCM1415651.1 energy-coupled thiamine transporter ThiT [bacterium]MCM1422971.1 energy-coupled thiamine transporter ThiT [bacterium]